MVDVGYFINGKHGVIKKVIPLSNTKTEHLCFMQADGEEQYALKKENIEYVVPSDIECVSDSDKIGKMVFDKDGIIEYDADGNVIMKGRYVENKNLLPPKPITFAEKFKEVFGFEPNRKEMEDICEIVNCDNISGCSKCPLCNEKKFIGWDDPYVKAEDIR